MSVLIVPAESSRHTESVADALIERLIAQDDEVRVVGARNESSAGEAWKTRGAHVAWGDPSDADLIERAAQRVRTIVILDVAGRYDRTLLDAVIDGARMASVDRLVYCGAARSAPLMQTIAAAGLGYVALWSRRRRLLGGGTPPHSLAEAIDAADDIAGDPRLDLDLTDRSAWVELGLDAP